MSFGKKRQSGILKSLKRISNDIFSDDTVEIHSGSLVYVTGCKKLKEYSKDQIKLSFKKYELVIEGEDLEPESLINGQISVRGTIKGVSFIDN